jgi:hypothetical protein
VVIIRDIALLVDKDIPQKDYETDFNDSRVWVQKKSFLNGFDAAEKITVTKTPEGYVIESHDIDVNPIAERIKHSFDLANIKAKLKEMI